MRKISKKSTKGLVRLNKFLADHGVASRRKADELIDAGKVQINGRKVFELGIKVDPANDSVKVSGKLIASKPQLVYFVFNKPKSVVTSTSDPQDRPTVMDFFKKIK
ncbi:MAG: S4 domain-containing protein, partial [Pseudomonadota bacterium]